MSILEELLHPLPFSEFRQFYLRRVPMAAPFKAARFVGLFDWSMVGEILDRHANCWLPKEGVLPNQPDLNTGQLDLEQVRSAFFEGRTLTVRHSEQSHPALLPIAKDFSETLKGPADIQLYATPGGNEGFGWHYDSEEVFVIQTLGEKEFRLRKNRFAKPPPHKDLPKTIDLNDWAVGPELRCSLKAGDWLYIPSGYWHKAKALSDSFHLSVGIMNPQV